MEFCSKSHQKICYDDEVGCPLCHALDVAQDLLERLERMQTAMKGQDRKVSDLTRMLERFEDRA